MKVDIYTTPTCGYCHQAKRYLASKGINFTEHDVSVDRSAGEEMVRLTGQMGVPVIVVDGEPVIGFNRGRLEQLFAGSGNGGKVSLGLKIADAARYSGREGAYIGAVAPSSPGGLAGLEPGDIISGVNNYLVRSAGDVSRLLSGLGSGSRVMIDVVRDNQPLRAEITL